MNTDALIRTSRRTVLIVEDEIVNQELLRFILQDSYDVLTANDGQAALDIIRQQPNHISMILLDINMPVLNGYELLKILQRDLELKKIPVIVLTSDKDAELKMLQAGAMDFISKPFDIPEIILARVSRIIQFAEDKRIIADVEHDPLTGLYTRAFFHEYCLSLMRAEPDADMDMIALDVDKFRMVNELRGTAFGDSVLIAMADGIRDTVHTSFGIAARCDADLFYIFMRHTPDHNGLYQAVAERVGLLKDRGTVRLRMGVYEHVDAERGIEWYSDAAKAACNSVRGNFMRSVCVYSDDMHKRQLFNERLVADIDMSMREGHFKVYFQPKYTVVDDKPTLTSAEALVRWIHPELGFISPGDFIPLLESNGLVAQLDDYVWRRVALKISQWRDVFGRIIPVSVNLSRLDLFDPTLFDRLTGIVRDNGIPIDSLLLEVTESAYSEDVDGMIRTVERLREAGFKIEMDDFGSGYSSLNMLCVMPVDAVKIDMKFVQNIARVERTDDPQKSVRLLESVINIAHSMGLPAIIEGVEDANQFNHVRSAGCDIVQGYYFSKPVDESAFENMLKEEATC